MQEQPKVILSDLGAVLLFSKDRAYKGKLNPIYEVEKDKADFDFFDFFELNMDLLNYYLSLKDKHGVEFFIVTEGFIQNDTAIKGKLDKVFNKIFSGKSLGLSKKDPELYIQLSGKIGKNVEDILFIDDSSDNIHAASEAGLQTHLFKDLETLKKSL